MNGRERGASVRPGLGWSRSPREAALGVVGLITPLEFPDRPIPRLEDRAPAPLCYGNAVVFKPAEAGAGASAQWPLSDDQFVRLRPFPAGVFKPRGRARASVGRPRTAARKARTFAAISFTGSVCPPGRKLAQALRDGRADERNFQLEMGGKNPLVVLDDADLQGRRRGPPTQRRLFLDRSALHGVPPRLIVTAGNP